MTLQISNLTSCASVVLEVILNSEIWIKYAEKVFFPCNIQTILFSPLIRNSLFSSFASQIYKRRVPELPAERPTPSKVSVS